MRWPKYWSFNFSISPSNEHPGLISFRLDWLDLLEVQGTLKSLLQNHSSKASILQLSIHPYCTALGASGICTLLTCRLQTPHSLSVRPTALQTANGFIFPPIGPWDWICDWSHPLSRTYLHLCYLPFSWVPPRNTGLYCSFSSYSILYRSFLQPELYSCLYVEFLDSFQWELFPM